MLAIKATKIERGNATLDSVSYEEVLKNYPKRRLVMTVNGRVMLIHQNAEGTEQVNITLSQRMEAEYKAGNITEAHFPYCEVVEATNAQGEVRYKLSIPAGYNGWEDAATILANKAKTAPVKPALSAATFSQLKNVMTNPANSII